MKYKRGINEIKSIENTDFLVSNNNGVYMDMTVVGKVKAPYHGLYIKQEIHNDRVLLSNIAEELDFGNGEIFNIRGYKTNEKDYAGEEYLVFSNTEPVPTYMYDINNCLLQKKYKFCDEENTLCIEYTLTNNSEKAVRFLATPLITMRGIFNSKRMSDMRFSSESEATSVKINLSITQMLDVYLKANSMRFLNNERFEKSITYDLEIEPNKIKTYVEDLYIPGDFEAVIRSGHTGCMNIFVSLTDIEANKYSSLGIEQKIIDITNDRLKNIDDAYFELKNLANTAYLLDYVDRENKKMVLLESIPTIQENDTYIKNIIASIDGNYLVLGRYKEAYKILESIMQNLKNDVYKLSGKDKCEAILLFIEAVNRYIQKSECRNSEVKAFYEYIKEQMQMLINGKFNCNMRLDFSDIVLDEKYLLKVNGIEYVKLNALWYNALRIYIFLQDKYYEASDEIYKITESVRDGICEKFWVPDKNILKYAVVSEEILPKINNWNEELTEIYGVNNKEVLTETYTNFDMMYTLCLSYPALHEKMAMKVIDTAFKELYTPLGMRRVSKNTEFYDGYIYPHLMVYFLKANLRQMGVTRATQKLGYNLVKDLLAQIGKDTVGTVRYKYFEKNKRAYGYPVNALTNAEIIRMFDLLT